MNDWHNLFTGDLVISRLTDSDLVKALSRLEREGFAFEAQADPHGRLVLYCSSSPNDALLAQMKEFRHASHE